MVSKNTLKSAIKDVWIKSLTHIPSDILEALINAQQAEESEKGQEFLGLMIKNAQLAAEQNTVICQDSGVPSFFVKTGLDFPYYDLFTETFKEALHELTLSEFVLRPMVVHPVTREDNCDNTGANVPIIHTQIVSGLDHLEITAVPKGAGTGNWGRLEFFTLSQGMAKVKEYIVDSIVRAGSNPCPPFIIGIGLGGTMEEVARLATCASIRPINIRHPEPVIADLENELFNLINATGIGVMGLGGSTTALAVNIEYSGTHKPWLPVAININCWPGRRATCTIDRTGKVTLL